MEKKYMLTDETRTIKGKILHRIKALKDFGNVKAGDLGGFIEKEENLSQEGNAWIGDIALVYGDARVYGNAQVYGTSRVFDNAQIYGDAFVCVNVWAFNNTRIYGNAFVRGNASIRDNAQIYGSAQVFGDAIVSENVQVYDNAQVYECACVNNEAQVHGNAFIYGDTRIYGHAQVYGNTRIYDRAQIHGNAQIYEYARACGHVHVCGDAVISQEQRASYGIVKTDLSKPESLVSSIRVQCNLLAIDGKVIAYKLVRPDLTSFYDETFQYVVGEEIEVKDCEETNNPCASGLHFSNLTYWESKIINKEYVCLEAEIDLKNIITVQRGKIRCRKAKILRAFNLD